MPTAAAIAGEDKEKACRFSRSTINATSSARTVYKRKTRPCLNKNCIAYSFRPSAASGRVGRTGASISSSENTGIWISIPAKEINTHLCRAECLGTRSRLSVVAVFSWSYFPQHRPSRHVAYAGRTKRAKYPMRPSLEGYGHDALRRASSRGWRQASSRELWQGWWEAWWLAWGR